MTYVFADQIPHSAAAIFLVANQLSVSLIPLQLLYLVEEEVHLARNQLLTFGQPAIIVMDLGLRNLVTLILTKGIYTVEFHRVNSHRFSLRLYTIIYLMK